MLKKILHYIIYGAAILFTIQYVFVGTFSPATVLSDISLCLQSPEECREENRGIDIKGVLPVLDTVSLVVNEKDREALLTSFEIDIIDQTNKERIGRGLSPLTPQKLLAQSAKTKAYDMRSRQYFEHDSPDGKGVSDLAKEASYDFLIVGENLALGDFKNPRAVVDAWMNSAGHRENILNPKYREIGVSMISGEYKGKQALFIVQHFGTDRSICPQLDQDLKMVIDVTTQKLKQDEEVIEALKDRIESESNIFSPEYAKNVSTFNTLVENYNQLLETSRAQVAHYNEEVRAFNACLVQYQ